LTELIEMVGGDPAEMSRAKLDSPTAGDVVAHLVANPADMQRPIAVLDGRAVIGRPSERVLEILN
jgi:arsenate reductase-like glutaredoxin family protein